MGSKRSFKKVTRKSITLGTSYNICICITERCFNGVILQWFNIDQLNLQANKNPNVKNDLPPLELFASMIMSPHMSQVIANFCFPSGTPLERIIHEGTIYLNHR